MKEYFDILFALFALLVWAAWVIGFARIGRFLARMVAVCKHFGAAAAVTLLVVGFAVALAFYTRPARGQAYVTNSTLVPGPYQYNSSFVPPYNASQVISNQAASGMSQGVIQPGQGQSTLLGVATLVSNNFSGIYYSGIPTVLASSSLAGTNGAISVASVTQSNFTLNVSTTNQTVYWMSIGH